MHDFDAMEGSYVNVQSNEVVENTGLVFGEAGLKKPDWAELTGTIAPDNCLIQNCIAKTEVQCNKCDWEWLAMGDESQDRDPRIFDWGQFGQYACVWRENACECSCPECIADINTGGAVDRCRECGFKIEFLGETENMHEFVCRDEFVSLMENIVTFGTLYSAMAMSAIIVGMFVYAFVYKTARFIASSAGKLSAVILPNGAKHKPNFAYSKLVAKGSEVPIEGQ
jgi:hypothetical protein